MEKKILIVDDSSFMRMTLKDILQKAGYEVVAEVGDAKSSLEKYKELRPDLVTMDIIMPEENGIYALKQIKEIDKTAKVVMVTAAGQEALVVDAMSSGAKGYITKPFKPEDVINAVKKVLPEEGRE